MESLCAGLIAAGILICAAKTLAAQPVYKCEVRGKVTYSHEPCLGAKVVDTTPTQGLDKASGVSRKSADVHRAEMNKAMADGLKPIFNETPALRETRHFAMLRQKL